jgi:hypothetical protein
MGRCLEATGEGKHSALTDQSLSLRHLHEFWHIATSMLSQSVHFEWRYGYILQKGMLEGKKITCSGSVLLHQSERIEGFTGGVCCTYTCLTVHIYSFWFIGILANFHRYICRGASICNRLLILSICM